MSAGRWGSTRKRTLEEAIHSKEYIERILSDITILNNDCWVSNRELTATGYDVCRYKGTLFYTHIVLYTIVQGPIPNGLELDHEYCSYRACINPFHTKPKTHGENLSGRARPYGTRPDYRGKNL